jgi:hypothetical protein
MICDTETLSPANPQFLKLCTCSRVEGPIGAQSNLRRAYLWRADRSMLSRSQALARCMRFHHAGVSTNG